VPEEEDEQNQEQEQEQDSEQEQDLLCVQENWQCRNVVKSLD
jgi:hypothetical protein